MVRSRDVTRGSRRLPIFAVVVVVDLNCTTQDGTTGVSWRPKWMAIVKNMIRRVERRCVGGTGMKRRMCGDLGALDRSVASTRQAGARLNLASRFVHLRDSRSNCQ